MPKSEARQKNKHAQALVKLNNDKKTPEERSARAKKAIETRWRLHKLRGLRADPIILDEYDEQFD